MSTHQSTEQDERTAAVIGTGCCWVVVFLFWALLIDMLYHAMVRHEAPWDLLVLYFGSAAIFIVHQARHKTLGKTYVKVAVLFGVIGAAVGCVLSMILAR